MPRKTLKPTEETKKRMEEYKRDGESWDGFLNRAVDAIEEDDGLPAGLYCSKCGEPTEIYTIVGGDLQCGDCHESPPEIESR